MSRFGAAIATSFLALGLAGGAAHAGDKVAVLNVEGDQSGQVEDALTSIVEDEHEVVSSQTFDEVAEKAGVKALDTKGIAKVAKRLAVAAVIEGVMTRQDDGYQLLVRVRTQEGKTTKKVAVLMPGKKLSTQDKKSLGKKVLAALDEIDPRSGRARKDENLDGEGKEAKQRAHTGKLKQADDEVADADDEPAPRDKPTKKHKAKAAKKDKHAKAARATDDDDEVAADDRDAGPDDAAGDELAMRDRPKHKKAARVKPEPRDDRAAADDDAAPAADDAPPAERAARDDDRDPPRAKRSPGRDGDQVAMRDDDDARAGDDDDEGVHARAARPHDDGQAPIQAAIVEAGASVVGRKLTFTSRVFDQAPRGYQGPFVPGGRVAGAIYPLALADRSGPAAGLGVDFEYDQVASLTTRTSQAMDVPLPTTSMHWMIGARYRIAFGHHADSASVALGVDYGRRVFAVNRTALPAGAILDIPDVDYKIIAPELALRIPLGPRVTLTADARALLFKSAGPIQTEAEYGAAKITGGEGAAGLEVAFTRNVMLHVAGTATMIGYAFLGNGQQSSNRDNDPTTKDVGGALDQYIGGTATLGITY